MATGRVLRFDYARGYGFIAPDSGAEDVFLHVNDLLDEKSLIAPGVRVEFDVEKGDRGPKATSARLVRSPADADLPVSVPARALAGDDGDGLCDVLPTREFTHEITEILLGVEPTLTGAQILQIRRRLTAAAEKYGWVEG